MAEETQASITAFLADPATHGASEAVTRVDTHISQLFLIGDRVFKLKRALHLPYLDFSTPEQRLVACEKELRLNRRTAPELYLGVRRITAGARGPEFDGTGALLDAVVEMRRFDQDAVFDAMAQQGALTSGHMDALAREITRFHADAPVDDRAGSVRRCHGDLHLRNICLYEGQVRLFDCLEFNDALATVDVLYDLAFLAMDLWHRGLHAKASQVVNRYCDTAGQEDGYVLLPFFMALRAAVRAHVTATQADSADTDAARLASEARAYFDLAEDLLAPSPARLVAVGGLSGSGKSTIAAALAPRLGSAPGARVISSDRTRKAMFRTDPDDPLPSDAYASEVSARVYADIARRAGALLADGVTVIADAVHDRAEDRDRVEQAATNARVPFDGFWLQADPEDLHARLETRDPGASDADADVLAQQLAHAPDRTGWQTVSTAGTPQDSVDTILAALTPASEDEG